MVKKIVMSLGIVLSFISISESYAEEQSSKWEMSRRLGELAIHMAPKSGLSVSDQGATMGNPNLSPTLKFDLAEFESLLKAGADQAALRIAGFEAAGQRKLGSGLRVMSSGKPGRVVHAEEGGLPLFIYLKLNKLQEACSLLAAYGPVSKNDVEEFKSSLKAASADLKAGNYSKFMNLVTNEVTGPMELELASYSQLKAKLKRLQTVAATKDVKLPSYMAGLGIAENVFETIDDNSTFESDGSSVWVTSKKGYLNFKKVGTKWEPYGGYRDAGSVSKVVDFVNSKGVVVDALSDGIEKGEITNGNIRGKIDEFNKNFLVPMKR